MFTRFTSFRHFADARKPLKLYHYQTNEIISLANKSQSNHNIKIFVRKNKRKFWACKQIFEKLRKCNTKYSRQKHFKTFVTMCVFWKKLFMKTLFIHNKLKNYKLIFVSQRTIMFRGRSFEKFMMCCFMFNEIAAFLFLSISFGH